MSIRAASRTIWPWIVGVQAVAFTASVAYCLYPFPFLDQIDWILGYFQHGIGSIFLLHNGHRLVIPRLFLIADLEIFNGRPIIGTLMGLMTLAGLAWLLVKASRDVMAKSGRGAVTAVAGITVLLLIRGYTLPDYVTPSIGQFILSLFFTALALGTCAQKKTGWRYTQSVTYGILASACGFNGLAVFPALAWIAWRLHRNFRAAIALTLITAIFSLLYIHGADPDATHAPDPWRVIMFVVEYFGMPWERLPITYDLALMQGALTIGVSGFLILRRVFRGPLQPGEAFLLAMSGTLLLTGLMTALGRGEVVDLQTQGSRYSVIVAAAQAVLFILIAPGLWRFVPKLRIGPLAKNAAIIALSIFLLIEQGAAAVMVHARAVEMADVERHVCAGDLSTVYLGKLYFSDTRRAYDFIQQIKARKLYCFGKT